MSGGDPGSLASQSTVGKGRIFDVGEEKEILQLLNYVRRGPFEVEDKTMLRDAVLDYTAAGDISLLKDYVSKLQSGGATLLHHGNPLGAVATDETAVAMEDQGAEAQSSALPADETANQSSVISSAPTGFRASRPVPVFGARSQGGDSPSQATVSPTLSSSVDEVPSASAALPDSTHNIDKDIDRDELANNQIDNAAPRPTTETNPSIAAAEVVPPVSNQPTPSAPDRAPAESAESEADLTAEKKAAIDPSVNKVAVRQLESTDEDPSINSLKESEEEVMADSRPDVSTPSAKLDEGPNPQPTSEAITPLDRVKEIKRLVNERVGNPVNLIDANNEIGREYMNSLLNAMKCVNGGSNEDIKLGMDRLEKAFDHVIQSLNSGETVVKGSGAATAAPEPKGEASLNSGDSQQNVAPAQSTPPVMDPSVSSTAAATNQADEPLAEVPPLTQAGNDQIAASPDRDKIAPVAAAAGEDKRAPEESPAAPSTDSTDNEADSPLPSNAGSADESPIATIPPVPEPPAPAAQSSPIKPPVTDPVSSETSDPEPSPKAPATDSSSDEINLPQEPQSLAARLAAIQESRAELTATRAAELKVEEEIESSDPLHSNSVSSGLQQLLSEWKLFKSSGLFGTGPNGYEHPLYKSLSSLPMSTIIAGRFDGATPEIKQSITDYMNGWRYEQGVVHEMNETFEHYLRRVIKHILDQRQK